MNRKVKVLALLALGFASTAFSSCASMFARPTAVTLTSEPPGAEWRTNYGASGTTPSTIIPPDQTKPLTVSFTAAGFNPQEVSVKSRTSAWIVANVAWGLAGVVGIIIDSTNKGAQVIGKDAIHAVLVPTDAETQGADPEPTSESVVPDEVAPTP
jgi:hypothetical protein